MAKAIKPLIIVLFILTAVALYFGVDLFGQREKISKRVTTLEKATSTIAKNIRYEGLNQNNLKDYQKMDSQLRPLEVAANLQFEELEDTKATLVKTEGVLEQTQTTLAATEQELETAETEIVTLNNDIASRDQEIASLEGDVEELETAKTELEEKVVALNDDLTTKNNELADAQADYDSLKLAYDEEVRNSIAGSTSGDGPVVMASDVAGQIMSVNAEWNFVVLDIGSEEGLKTHAEMLVHRGNNLVGRIRISEVRPRMAVAEILNDWEQLPISTGDMVISPQS